MSDALLQVDDMHTYLGDSYVIQGVSLEVPAGKVLAVLIAAGFIVIAVWAHLNGVRS